MKTTKILISGGGIAGYTLAYWLKKHGFTPVIVEKHPHQRGGGYKVDVRGAALDVVKKMGVYQNLLDASVNLTASKFVAPDLKAYEFSGDLLGHVSEGDIEVNRFDLATILAKATAEIEIIYDDSIVKIDDKVHFEHASPREFDIIVGADGVYSGVSKLIFGDHSNYLHKFGINFAVFPAPNLFQLDHAEIVYLEGGAFVAAYASKEHSYGCFAVRTEEGLPQRDLKKFYSDKFSKLKWKIPKLVEAMEESGSCYYNEIAQVRMSSWSKGNVALIGDAAHATSAMGTSLAIVGGYVLAQSLAETGGDFREAFKLYETSLRSYVENAQYLAAKNHESFFNTTSPFKLKLMLFLLKLIPKSFRGYLQKKGRKKMQDVANAYTIK